MRSSDLKCFRLIDTVSSLPSQVVDEADILIAFASTVRRQSLEYNGIPMKKPRNGLKGVGKVVR